MFKYAPEYNLQIIDNYQARAFDYQQEEIKIRQGFSLFRIDQAQSKDLEFLVRVIDLVKQLWNVSVEFTQNWLKFKDYGLYQLKQEELDEIFGKIEKKLARFGKDARDWQLYQYLNGRTTQLVAITKLLPDLQNTQLKQKHWAEISTLVGQSCNPFDSEFVMEKMVDYKLGDFVKEIEQIICNK
jgi:dynein heavy chain